MRAAISLGSNIDPLQNIPRGLALLRERLAVVGESPLYWTEPFGPPGQPEYVNGVALVETDMDPAELKRDVLRRIETDLGRVRTGDPYEPRELDLDILVCGDMTSDDPFVPLPHPDTARLVYMAVPLHDVWPDLVLPDGTVLADALPDLHGRILGPAVLS